jgi:hypothetical protein
VHDGELRAALQTTLRRHFQNNCVVVSLSRRPSPYCTSFALEEVDVALDDGLQLELMFKDLNWFSMLKSAQLTKPFFLYDPLREIDAYRSILKSGQLGTARCYGTRVKAETGHYWVFMERVAGLQLRHVGDFQTWKEAARWLAHLHSDFGRTLNSWKPSHRSHLLYYDRTLCRQWMLRAEALFHHAQSTHSPSARREIRWLARRYHKVVERIVDLPVTFMHGEFSASNVIVPLAPGAARPVCPVDWEMAAIGPGLLDLAGLTSGTWTDDQIGELADTYFEALAPSPSRPRKAAMLRPLLDLCNLHLAVQWLGWSLEWAPPPDQAQDWLSVALRLAEKLRL